MGDDYEDPEMDMDDYDDEGLDEDALEDLMDEDMRDEL